MKKVLLLTLAIGVAAASQASFTLGTFSDPATSSSTPLFTWDKNTNTISGSWTGNGLTLDQPGFIGGGNTPNTHFVMNPVALTTVIPNVLYMMGAGQVDFYTTNISSPFFSILFNGGTFLNPFNAGASQLTGNVVNFVGANVPGPLTSQQFSFSFVNPVTTGNVTTFTSAFTSSAELVPEPVSMVALGTAVAAVVARRRKRA